VNLLQLFDIQRRERPEAVALRGEDGEGWTYGELLAAADGVGAGWAEGGLRSGDRVALLAGNRPELVVAQLAALRLGAILVPVNPAYRARELAHLLADAEPRLVVTEAESAGVLEEVEPGARRSVERVARLEELAARRPSQETAPAGCRPRKPDGSDPALIVYTSGTTGRSKGAVLTHDNLLATVTGLLAAWAWRPDDVLLLTLPLFHVHGLVVGLWTALAAGARVELRRRFDAAAVADELVRAPRGPGRPRPTFFFGVPTMYVRLVAELRRRAEAGQDLSALGGMRLFASGSAPLAPGTFHAFRELTGHAILERYGMSEAGMLLSNPYAGERRPGTVGVPLPGVSVRIVDPEGPEGPALPDGEAGELLMAGSNVFDDYWRDPEKTTASFVKDESGRRWFRTGDVGRQDPATGYVTLLGRRHDLILRGGLNVYPREIEEVLAAFPGVREAAVAGRPDAEWGEVPVAWIVPEEGPAPHGIDPDALLAHCRTHLAPFKVPAEIRLVDDLPRNALGKLQKHRLA
jgi:malonyl-CoA/methylmalonyl-CoA synthetase